MPKRVSGNLLVYTTSSSGFTCGPLHASSTNGDRFTSTVVTVKEIFNRFFYIQISFNSSPQKIAERNIAVFSAFPLPDMERFSVKIDIRYL
jgi:hypothetical protein